jgi:hypothetical protein
MEVDILVIADAAQVAGDKLQLIGGGWRFIQANQLPVTHHLSVAVGLLVGWLETNRRHRFRLEVRQDEPDRVIAAVDGDFETGRPPGYPAGEDLRVMFASNLALRLEHDGHYVVRLLLNDQEARRTSFLVIDKSKPKPA